MASMPFSNLPPRLAGALAARGYATPTPVQAAVLEPEAEGRDLIVSAQTGSGKTVAFGLALATTLLGDADRISDDAAPQALIIAPTRELALQVSKELEWLYARTGARIATCVVARMLIGEHSRISLAQRRASFISWSCGTTAVTNPRR